ncbi:MAG TPA: YesL family protein [Thermomicrobiales bacterium]|nr:YesL family protein [Thermomicrobiales bacterium]
MFMILSFFSLLWWVCAILIVPMAPATVALFSMADPRRHVSVPELSDAIDVFKTSWKRSWGIWLLTVPFIAMLLWNLTYFSGTSSLLAAMVPLWIVLLVLLWIVALYAFSMAGTMESGVRNAFRGAMYVLVVRPGVSIALGLFLIVLIGVMSVMVIPMLLFGPALVASIVNRVTLTALGEEIIDPSAPTVERAREQAAGINPEPGLVSRFRGKKPHQGN